MRLIEKHRIEPATAVRARSLRRGMTDAERKLWSVIREKQLNGFRFRRQHPIGRYVVDFACPETGLVVELDGGQHQDQVAYDEQRVAFIENRGWRVLRFWNNEVLGNLDGVLTVIAETLDEPSKVKT